ncbi:MAG: right-handed parallel beta-helix repeat-containing protein, partial [Planctomycetota bacterium]
MTTATKLKLQLITTALLLGISATVDNLTYGFAVQRLNLRTTYYIDASAPDGGNGLTWSTALNHLQDGLSAADNNDEIWVAEGAYTPDKDLLNPEGSGDRAATFQLKNGVVMLGGFPAGGGDLSERDPNQYETILSGDIGTPDDPNDNCYHVVTASGTDADTILDGFIITGGNADGPEPDNRGGGIYNDSGNLQIRNCTILNNSAGYFDFNEGNIIFYPGEGAGFYNYNANPTLTNCSFIENSSTVTGGAMVNVDSSPMIISCMFNRNVAPGVAMGYWWPLMFGLGGGIVNYNSNPQITNCTFTNNEAGNGGGIYNDPNSSPAVTDCTFTENIATFFEVITFSATQSIIVGEGSGGGICNTGSNPMVTNCTFTANQALYDGGGISNTNSNSEVINCTFGGNVVTGLPDGDGWDGEPLQISGGGMSNYESSPTVTNCSFTDNEAGNGAGISNDSNSCPLITDCTFSENLASYVATFTFSATQTMTVSGGSGGGICNAGSNPIVTNCTFSANEALLDGGAMNNTLSAPIVTNCTFTGNWATGYTHEYPPPYSRYSFHIPGVGGAIHNEDSEPVFSNCTFAANRAEIGNALSCDYTDYQQSSEPSYILLTNCILRNGGDEIYNNDGSTITISYSDVDGGWEGEGNIDVDPEFVNPGYWDPNETPADPNDDFWVEGDYRLLPGSPCVDAGDPDYIAGPDDVDLDGNPRIIHGKIDMGAFEYWKYAPNPADLNGDGAVDY